MGRKIVIYVWENIKMHRLPGTTILVAPYLNMSFIVGSCTHWGRDRDKREYSFTS